MRSLNIKKIGIMKEKIIYWVTTSLIAGLMVFSAIAYFTNPVMAENFIRLGFSDFFRLELAIAKIIGAIVLLIPAIPIRVREWVFAGFSITFLSAAMVHIAAGDPIQAALFPIIILGILILSHTYYFKVYH